MNESPIPVSHEMLFPSGGAHRGKLLRHVTAALPTNIGANPSCQGLQDQLHEPDVGLHRRMLSAAFDTAGVPNVVLYHQHNNFGGFHRPDRSPPVRVLSLQVQGFIRSDLPTRLTSSFFRLSLLFLVLGQ